MSAAANLPAPMDLPALQSTAFKRVRPKHMRVVALHLMGESNEDIERALKHNAGYVSYVLNNDAVQPVLQRAYADYEREISGMTSLAIEAIRRNLNCGDGSIELRAADLLFKRQGAYDKAENKRDTAEDVVQRILEVIGSDGTRVRMEERRLLNRGGGHGEAADGSTGEVIDV